MTEPTACIIGASRGLGLGLVQRYLAAGWRVIGTVRGEAPTALHALIPGAGGRLAIERLDINLPAELEDFRTRLAGRRCDLLFVNAGVSNGPAEQIGSVSTDEFTRVMVTNALSPMRVVEALEALVPQDGLIALMSSGLGSVANNDSGGWEVYRASKAALNTLMRSFAARQAGAGRSLALVAPGWVRTDMGGPDATLDVATSTAGILASLAGLKGRPGLHYLDYQGRTLPW